MRRIKKWMLAAILICGTTMVLSSCSSKDNSSSTEPKNAGAPDYSQKSCWHQIPEITKEFDTFFIYPTEYIGSNEGDPDYASLDNPDMLQGAKNDHIWMASAFEESTNLFMPYYRQASAMALKRAYDKTGDIRAALESRTPYEDITAALDYYFENYNNGRPFIIASHSQGSAINSLVMKSYFKEHPDYYKRMVASYMIGFSLTKDWLKDSPHLKCATGEADTGVIVSWNTEGKLNVEQNAKNVVVLPGGISINPLNWKLDETYAPASMNKGTYRTKETPGEYEILQLDVDAQVNLARGVIVTTTTLPVTEGADFFGPASFHEDDYQFFYNNIKENVAKRIATYKNSAK